MPTSKEVVPNRPLAGHELKAILIRELDSMLSNDGMFSSHLAYRRVAYEISVKLHVDNPQYPSHKNTRISHNPARNAPDESQAVFAPPLKDPSPESQVAAVTRERVIDSPNVARLENDLPVTITAVNRQTGAVEEKQVRYDKEGLTPVPPKDTDISQQVADDWGVVHRGVKYQIENEQEGQG